MNSRRPMSSAGLLPHFGPSAPAMTISSPAAPSPAGRNYVEGGGANGAPGARGSSCRLVGHDANHWRDFRYPWPAAAAGARGACRLRSHHPSPDVLARLGALAPVHAVRGNVDHGVWSANLPVTQRIEIDGFRIYVLHILAELDPQAADNVD